MRIDLNALRIAAAGDQSARVTVKRAWLTAVMKELEAAAARDRHASERDMGLDEVSQIYMATCRPGLTT